MLTAHEPGSTMPLDEKGRLQSLFPLFHVTQVARFMIAHRERDKLPEVLHQFKPEQSIGAVYHSETPEAERAAHYFTARLAEQFDAVLYFDKTRAGEPRERTPLTYPFEV
jgi:erythromycin esterase-like protein